MMAQFERTLSRCHQRLFAGKWPGDETAVNLLRRCLEAMPKYLNEFPLALILESQLMVALCRVIDAVAKTSNARNAPRCLDEIYRSALMAETAFFYRKFTELKTADAALRQKVHSLSFSLSLCGSVCCAMVSLQENAKFFPKIAVGHRNIGLSFHLQKWG